MTALTAAKIDLVLLALELRQREGTAPMPGKVTPEYLARLSAEIEAPLSEGPFNHILRTAKAKAEHRLRQNGINSALDLYPES